jgi:hypothetical protein
MKQNQVIAIEKGAKSQAERALTDSHHKLGRAELIGGMTRSYTPHDAEGDKLPTERKLVQTGVAQELARLIKPVGDYFDIVATKSITNTKAQADLPINGTKQLPLPVDLLLFLEKQLVNLHTFVAKLPVLDPSETWEWSDERACYVTDIKEQVRTKKVLRNHVKSEATKEHPAQVDVYTEDIPVGTWATTKFSGALPAKEKEAMVERIEQLQAAVKQAREEANMTEADKIESFGERILRFVFEGDE